MADNCDMPPSTRETVKRFEKASASFRKAIQKDPQKAKTFLIKAGILVESKSSPSGVKLAKQLRPNNGN